MPENYIKDKDSCTITIVISGQYQVDILIKDIICIFF